MSEDGAERSLRIGKFLAQVGLISRREAAAYLKEHDVRIGETRITDLNYRVPAENRESIQLSVDGEKIPLGGKNSGEVILLHKPRGVACSHRRQKIRGKELSTIFDLVPKEFSRWFFAGRLDVSSEGLVVLSNDGDHIFELSHPSHGVLKRYIVRTSRPLSEQEMARLEKGIFDKGEKLRFEKILPLEIPAKYEIHLREGKNREIRRLLERCGVFARQLVRVSLGPYELGEIAPGKFAMVSQMKPGELSHLTHRGPKGKFT